MTSHTAPEDSGPGELPSNVTMAKTSGNSVRIRIDESPDEFMICIDFPFTNETSVRVRPAPENYLEIIGESGDLNISERIRFPEPVTENNVQTEFNNNILTVRVARDSQPS